PDGGVETILQGSRVFYRFAARAADKTYEQILKSLAEPEPRERMRGFVLVEDDPRRGRSYWHDATGAVVTVPPGYSRAPVFLGRGLRYDLAFRHDTDAFEARLRFDPTAEQSAQYQATRLKPCFREGTCPATDPDEPSDLWAAALAGTITAETPRFDIIGPIAALYDFHADWGMLSQGLALSRSRAFNRGYGVGVLLQVHKNAVGNYFVAFLAADYPTLNRHTSDQEDSLVKVDLGIKFPRAR
ncbi:MAG TPA: hypothetical protein VNI01_07730, partial [Elusimicrobiota bacterium]|nr:hypothetical protein [Elusimicrobiota bacterium]